MSKISRRTFFGTIATILGGLLLRLLPPLDSGSETAEEETQIEAPGIYWRNPVSNAWEAISTEEFERKLVAKPLRLE